MKTTFDVACQGLDEFAVGQPLITLADWLNDNTPTGIHFNVVGGIDPQLQQETIEQSMIVAAVTGSAPIFVGHSKGAMEAFYAIVWG